MIINLDGQPTYFMTLKDNAGLIKQYAFVSVSNYTNVGTGETIDSALRNFRQVRGNAGVNITTGQTISKEEGTVLRIASETIDNTVTYKLILEEKQDYIFTVSYDLSNELALTQPGDKVALEYMDDRPESAPRHPLTIWNLTSPGSNRQSYDDAPRDWRRPAAERLSTKQLKKDRPQKAGPLIDLIPLHPI